MRNDDKHVSFIVDTVLLIGLMVLFGIAAISLGQDNTSDARSYHFYDGFAFLYNRLDWNFAPAGHQTYFNPIFDVINYLLIIKTSPTIITGLHGALTGVTLFIIYLMGELLFVNVTQHQRIIYLFFSVLIGASSTDNLSLLGLITNDSKATLLVVLSLYFLLKSLRSKDNARFYFIIFAGLLSGFSTAFKLTTACYTVASCTGLFCIVLQDKRHLSLFVLYVITAAVGFLIGDGYWLTTLYQHFSNPFFPFYNHIFHSPYAADSNYKDSLYYPHDYFIYPFLIGFFKTSTEEHLRDMRFAIIYVLGVIFFAKWVYYYFRNTKAKIINKDASLIFAWQTLFIWFLVGYLLWFYLFTIFRYALPLEIVTGLMITYLLHQLVRSQRLVMIFLIVLTIILFSTTVKTRYDRIPMGQHFYVASPPSLPSNAIVFLGSYPIQYTIPFFPKDIHFVGDVGLINNKDALTNLVTHNKDRVFILQFTTRKGHRENNNFSLFLKSQYDLSVNKNCLPFSTNIGDQLELCQCQGVKSGQRTARRQ